MAPQFIEPRYKSRERVLLSRLSALQDGSSMVVIVIRVSQVCIGACHPRLQPRVQAAILGETLTSQNFRAEHHVHQLWQTHTDFILINRNCVPCPIASAPSTHGSACWTHEVDSMKLTFKVCNQLITRFSETLTQCRISNSKSLPSMPSPQRL